MREVYNIYCLGFCLKKNKTKNRSHQGTCLFCGGQFLCLWGRAKKTDVGRSDKNSKLIMAVTVTWNWNLANGQQLQTMSLCIELFSVSWRCSVLSRPALFSAWIRNLRALHSQLCTPAGSNKRTTSSLTAAALLFSSKYQLLFEFIPRHCSLM